MRAMVLGAGHGTRLRPLTDELPKPAVPVLNRPLGWYAIDHLARHGAEVIVVNAHHLGEELERALAPHLPRGPALHFAHEARLLGTGGGLSNARALLTGGSSGPVVVMNGDVIFPVDLGRALSVHTAAGALATMVLRAHPRADEYGAVELDREGRVRRLLGSPGDRGDLRPYMFTGVHVLSPRAFDDLPREGCIVRTAYRQWVDAGDLVLGVVDGGPWLEVGDPAAYLHANLALAASAAPWPGLDGSGRTHAIDPAAAVAPSAHVEDSVIGRNAVIGPRARLRSVVVWPGARVDGALERAIATPRRVVPVAAGAPER